MGELDSLLYKIQCVYCQKIVLPSHKFCTNDKVKTVKRDMCLLIYWAWGSLFSPYYTEDVGPAVWPKTHQCMPCQRICQNVYTLSELSKRSIFLLIAHLYPPSSRDQAGLATSLMPCCTKRADDAAHTAAESPWCRWLPLHLDGIWRIRLMQLKTKLEPWFAGGTFKWGRRKCSAKLKWNFPNRC